MARMSEQGPRRNPFKNEGDAFRIVVMFVIAAVVVIAATELVGGWLGALIAAALVVAGIWATAGWLRAGLRDRD